MTLLKKPVGAGANNRPADVALMQFILANAKSKATRKPYLARARIDGRMSRELEGPRRTMLCTPN